MAHGSLRLAAMLAALAAPAAAQAVPQAAPERPALPNFDGRVTSAADLPTAALRDARHRMLDDQPIGIADLRALADAGDGLAAVRFAREIEAMGDPSLLGDAAHYYATAAYAGRGHAVPPLIRLLRRPETQMGPARAAHIENVLKVLAAAGDRRAAEALMGFYAAGTPFGAHPDRLLDLRLTLAIAGDEAAATAIVMEALSGRLPEGLEAETLDTLLDAVAASERLGLRALGENLRRELDAGTLTLAAAPAPPEGPTP